MNHKNGRTITAIRTCFVWFMTAGILGVPSAMAAKIRLDGIIGPVRLHSGADVYDVCEAANMACGIEEDAVDGINTKSEDVTMRKTTIRAALNKAVARYGHYKWTIRNNVVNVEPLHRTTDGQLSKKLARVSIHGLSSLSAAITVLREANINVLIVNSSSSFYGRVDFDLKDVTVREALNEIARQDGEFIWAFHPATDPSKNGGASFTSFRKMGMSIRDIHRIEHN